METRLRFPGLPKSGLEIFDVGRSCNTDGVSRTSARESAADVHTYIPMSFLMYSCMRYTSLACTSSRICCITPANAEPDSAAHEKRLVSDPEKWRFPATSHSSQAAYTTTLCEGGWQKNPCGRRTQPQEGRLQHQNTCARKMQTPEGSLQCTNHACSQDATPCEKRLRQLLTSGSGRGIDEDLCGDDVAQLSQDVNVRQLDGDRPHVVVQNVGESFQKVAGYVQGGKTSMFSGK